MEVYDFGIGWIDEDSDGLFINALHRECDVRGLRFLKVNETALEHVSIQVRSGKLKIRFYLDLASETENLEHPFTKFAYLLKDTETRVVADVDQVRFSADKSITHFNLINAGIPVPRTVVIRNWEPSRRLTMEEREKLGLPIVIKPATGYGQRGVRIVREKLSLPEMAEARNFDPGDHFLLQEFVEPETMEGKPVWFRIFFLFGELFPCWWNPFNGVYSHAMIREFERHRLMSMVRIASDIAEVVRIEWFSCEIAMPKNSNRFVVIDYMNDQCDVTSQSFRPAGVPDDLLLLLARRMAEKAWQWIRGNVRLHHRAIWFSRVHERSQES
jgi:hypothetical protein